MADEETSNVGVKAKRERSAAYPAISLSKAVEYSGKLLLAHPKSEFDRESAALAIGYEKLTGTSSPKVAAMAHFGLIDRRGNAYKNSELAKRIHDSLSEQEKKEAVLEAVMRPKLFNALITEYVGCAIPSTLNSVLVRNHHISRKVAEKVVETFKESVEYAGIYENGIIKSVVEENAEEKDSKNVADEKGEELAKQTEEKVEVSSERQHRMVDITLPSGAVVSYPSNVAFHIQTDEEYLKVLADLEKVVKNALDKNSK